MAADAAPLLKLVTDSGPKLLPFSPEGTGVYSVTDATLEGEPIGRIEMKIGGLRYQPDLPKDHGH